MGKGSEFTIVLAQKTSKTQHTAFVKLQGIARQSLGFLLVWCLRSLWKAQIDKITLAYRPVLTLNTLFFQYLISVSDAGSVHPYL